jgi:hypothetical protein
MTIRNTSSNAVVLNSVTIEGQGNAQDQEWRLDTADIVETPLEISGLTLEPDGYLDFYPRFMPVEGTARSALVTITYDGGTSYTFTIDGEGSPSSTFLSVGSTTIEQLLGEAGEDEQFGALVADPDGNAYFTANHETANDRIILARMNVDGSLGWAKLFDGPYSDRQIDPGQNSETGGAAGSLDFGSDGYLYLTGTYSWTPSNNSFYVWLAKVDPADGSLVWSNLWSSVETIGIARESSTAYALDATGSERVFVVGTTEGESQLLVLAFDMSDGSIVFGRKFEVAEGVNDRAYSVSYAGDGVLYVGGQTAGNAGFVMRLTGVDGNSPEVDWFQQIGLGTGGNVNDLASDASGNVYATYDIRGAATIFGFGSLDSSGGLRWSRAYAGNEGAKHNVHAIELIDGTLYVAGRTAGVGFDGQMGDGNLVAIDPDTAQEIWSSTYYTGEGNTDLCEHRVKGIAIVDNRMIVGLQAYTGTQNGVRYSGYWYDGLGATVEFSDPPAVSAGSATMTLIGVDDGDGDGFVQPIDESSDLSATWTDATQLIWQVASEKHDGSPPDADAMIMVIDLN